MEKPSTPLISPASHTQSESLSIPVLSTSLTNISEFPSSVQENILIEELLYCLLGIYDGLKINFTRKKTSEGLIRLRMEDQVEPVLRQLAEKIALSGLYFSQISSFVEKRQVREAGLINHCLSSSLRTILKEYYLFVAQLENQHKQGRLTLQLLWFYVDNNIKTLELISNLLSLIGKQKGAAVITLLHSKLDRSLSVGSDYDLTQYLAEAATRPFLQMLQDWIYKGKFEDPYNEFMISMQTFHVDRLDSRRWNKDFVLDLEKVPRFFTVDSEKILKTGKYLNVIKECNRKVQFLDPKTISYSTSYFAYRSYIEEAYNYASKTLLNVLLKEKHLLLHFRTLKGYFLHGSSFFLSDFLDLAEDELSLAVSEILISKLELFLERALQTERTDLFKQQIKCAFAPVELFTELFNILKIDETSIIKTFQPAEKLASTGNNLFSLAYTLPWPMPLVISNRVLTKYTFLFRYLFFLMVIERRLCCLWKDFIRSSKANDSRVYAATLRIMLGFIKNLRSFYLLYCIESNWSGFENKILAVKTLDEVLITHNDFLDTCLKQCMLTNKELFQKLYSLLKLIEDFCAFSFLDFISIQESARIFSEKLKEYVRLLNFHASTDLNQHLLRLIIIINYNQFF